jgi:hypothetical protein
MDTLIDLLKLFGTGFAVVCGVALFIGLVALFVWLLGEMVLLIIMGVFLFVMVCFIIGMILDPNFY